MLLAYLVIGVIVSLAVYLKAGGPLWKVLIVYGLLWPIWLLVFICGGLHILSENRKRKRNG